MKKTKRAKRTKRKSSLGYTKPKMDKIVAMLKIALAVGGGVGLSRGLAYLLSKIDKNQKLDDVVANLLIATLGVVGATAFVKNQWIKHVGIGVAGVQILDAIAKTTANVIPTGNGTFAQFTQATLGQNTAGTTTTAGKTAGLGNPFTKNLIDWGNVSQTTDFETLIEEEQPYYEVT